VDERLRLLEEIASTRRNVRLQALARLMELWGFEQRTMRRGGHGAMFTHRVYTQIIVTAARPKAGQTVKVCYITECLRAIDRVQDMEDNTDA
jgi:hypothetical protein